MSDIVFSGGRYVVAEPPLFSIFYPSEPPDADGRLAFVLQSGGAALTVRLTPSEMKKMAKGIVAMADVVARRNQ